MEILYKPSSFPLARLRLLHIYICMYSVMCALILMNNLAAEIHARRRSKFANRPSRSREFGIDRGPTSHWIVRVIPISRIRSLARAIPFVTRGALALQLPTITSIALESALKLLLCARGAQCRDMGQSRCVRVSSFYGGVHPHRRGGNPHPAFASETLRDYTLCRLITLGRN